MFAVYVLALALVAALAIYNLSQIGNEDKNWKSRAFMNNVFFMVFISFLVAYLIILRPTSSRT